MPQESDTQAYKMKNTTVNVFMHTILKAIHAKSLSHSFLLSNASPFSHSSLHTSDVEDSLCALDHGGVIKINSKELT